VAKLSLITIDQGIIMYQTTLIFVAITDVTSPK